MRRLLALAVAAFLLAGCEAPPFYGPSPTPLVEPFFANEEEALDAVDAFMTEYVAASTLLLRSGGSDTSALAPLVSPAQLEDDANGAREIASVGDQFVGALGYFGLEIQQFHQDSATVAAVQAYVCMDYRESSYVGADGTTFEGERLWAPFEAIMTADREKQIELRELRYWSGRDFCDGRS